MISLTNKKNILPLAGAVLVFLSLLPAVIPSLATEDVLSYEVLLEENTLSLKENGQLLLQGTFEEENPAVAFIAFNNEPYFTAFSPLGSASPSAPVFFSLPKNTQTFWSFSGDFSFLHVGSAINTPLPIQLEENTFIDQVELFSPSAQLQGLGRINDLICTENHLSYPWTSGTSYIQTSQIAEFEAVFNDFFYGGLSAALSSLQAGNGTPVASISLGVESIYIPVGEEILLTPTILPENASDKAFFLSSENKQVATINNTTGAIQAKQAGTSKITLTTRDGNFTASTLLTAVDAYIQTENLFFVANQNQGPFNQPIEAFISFPPQAEVFWSSSNPSVASFIEKTSQGALFSIHLNQSQSAFSTIELSVSIENITIKSTIEVAISSELLLPQEVVVHRSSPTALTLKGISAQEATQIAWHSSDPAVATIDPKTQVITAFSMGETTLTATMPQGNQALCRVLVPGIKSITDNITLTGENHSQGFSQQIQVQAMMPPGTPIQWVSDNPAFVSLSSTISDSPETTVTVSLPQEAPQTAWITALITVDGVSYSDSMSITYTP